MRMNWNDLFAFRILMCCDFSPNQPRDKNGRWTNGRGNGTIKRPKISRAEYNRVSSGILTDHPDLQAGPDWYVYYYGKNKYRFSVNAPGEYNFHSKERIKSRK